MPSYIPVRYPAVAYATGQLGVTVANAAALAALPATYAVPGAGATSVMPVSSGPTSPLTPPQPQVRPLALVQASPPLNLGKPAPGPTVLIDPIAGVFLNA